MLLSNWRSRVATYSAPSRVFRVGLKSETRARVERALLPDQRPEEVRVHAGLGAALLDRLLEDRGVRESPDPEIGDGGESAPRRAEEPRDHQSRLAIEPRRLQHLK